MGSDVLIRPEDESSPEFREYLRQLLRLQANRAKTGYSAPSSSSSDAYFAKLNRLKLERRKLREAGLPEDLLDTSYTPEDYRAAVYEGQDPLVSDKVLVGDEAIPGRKKATGQVRSLTLEEIETTKEAESRVERAIQEAKAKGIPIQRPSSTVYQNTPAPSVQTDPSLDEAIDALLSGRGIGPTAAAIVKTTTTISSVPAKPVIQSSNTKTSSNKSLYAQAITDSSASAPTETPPVDNTVVSKTKSLYTQAIANAPIQTVPTSTAVTSSPPIQTNTPVTKPPPPIQTVAKSVTSTPNIPPPSAVVKAVTSSSTNLPPPPVAKSANTLPTNPSIKSQTESTNKTKKLDRQELESFAKALQLLVKHRGGGPFGKGRLFGQEQEDLVASLVEVTSFLEKESFDWFTPDDSDSVESSDQTQIPNESITTPTIESTTKEEYKATTSEVTSTTTSEITSIAPIDSLVVVDSSINSLSTISTQELTAIREKLLNSLAAIQTELISRSKQPVVKAISSTANKIQSNEVINNKSIETTNNPVSSIKPVDKSSDVTKEVTQALGLLLKHRGGPGFGHGRLEGKELQLLENKLREVSKLLLDELSKKI
eukprot:gene21872-28314_t